VLAGTAAAQLALGSVALALRPALERALRARIESEGARRGLIVRMETVRVGLWPPLRLTGVALETRSSWRLSADQVDISWIGRTHLRVKNALLGGPAGLTLAAASTGWDLAGVRGDDFTMALKEPQEGLVLSRTSGLQERAWSVTLENLPVGRLLDVKRFNRPLLDGGMIRGSLLLKTSEASVRFDGDLAARSARLPALTGDPLKPAGLGKPTEVLAKISGVWSRAQGTLEIPRWSAEVEGASMSGSLMAHDLEADPAVDLALDVQRVDFARLMRTWGLEPPEGLGRGAAAPVDLGSATLAATAKGRVSEPASFVVTQKLDFTPPQPMPPAIMRLRGGFVHEVTLETGARRGIDVSPVSPDFIALSDVPPLFLRALLIAEDAGFYGHPGIDLRELPSALITDWNRGGAARGASTITQQLAKNLFLSHEKELGRKLQELALTCLLEAALDKRRILEIYLNVIQWGPNLYGLRPAARAYFDREPAELSPAQMAFLVSIIPGPVKYQSSFAHGTPGPGLRKLVDGLLAKLRSVDALTDEEYQSALAEDIVVEGRGARPEPAAEAPQTQPE